MKISEICGHNFTEKRNLKRHTSTVHEEKKPFKCKYCEHTSTLKCHLLIDILLLYMRERNRLTVKSVQKNFPKIQDDTVSIHE